MPWFVSLFCPNKCEGWFSVCFSSLNLTDFSLSLSRISFVGPQRMPHPLLPQPSTSWVSFWGWSISQTMFLFGWPQSWLSQCDLWNRVFHLEKRVWATIGANVGFLLLPVRMCQLFVVSKFFSSNTRWAFLHTWHTFLISFIFFRYVTNFFNTQLTFS